MWELDVQSEYTERIQQVPTTIETNLMNEINRIWLRHISQLIQCIDRVIGRIIGTSAKRCNSAAAHYN